MADTQQTNQALPAKKSAAKKESLGAVTREEFEALKTHVNSVVHRLGQHGINVHRPAKPVAAAPTAKK